jgi:uncharacterized damage-inducible protein DinB
MNELSNTITQELSATYQDYARRVRALAESLTEEQFWRKPYPYGNSFGHLTLHLTGNLNYYIGAQITGYVRDRPREFAETNPPSKEEALRRFDEAVALVLQTLGAQSPDDWARAYHGVGAEYTSNRLGIFLRCVTHLYHHIGQMIYLGKEFARESARAA